MPADERVGLHDDQGILPVEQPSQRRHREPRNPLSVWRGVCSRSTKKAGCLRRKGFSAARALCERTRFRANARALTKAGTTFESRRKSEPFHVHNDVGSPHPFAAKRPILAGLNYEINDGSSFCGAQVDGRDNGGGDGDGDHSFLGAAMRLKPERTGHADSCRACGLPRNPLVCYSLSLILRDAVLSAMPAGLTTRCLTFRDIF